MAVTQHREALAVGVKLDDPVRASQIECKLASVI